MSSRVFQDMVKKATGENTVLARSKESIDWYRKAARRYKRTIQPEQIEKSVGSAALKSRIKVGGMYMFQYSAKFAEELPYWDRVPLIIPFNEDKTHFWAINFHYAPPIYRAVIMDELYSITENPNTTEQQKSVLTWNLLKNMTNSKLIKPLVHCYLKSRVQSQFINIETAYWNIALFLPTQQFQKQSVRKVYSDYQRKVK